MNIAFNIEQHRRQRARTAITAAVTDHARTEYKHAVPPPGAGPLTLLTWASCIELALRVLADHGALKQHGVTSALDVAGVRARYVDSARHDVPVVLDFRGTALAPICDSCEEPVCECPDGPTFSRDDGYARERPNMEPRSEADIELLAAAGYRPCPGSGCRDWLLPEEMIEGKCAACYVAEADPDPEATRT